MQEWESKKQDFRVLMEWAVAQPNDEGLNRQAAYWMLIKWMLGHLYFVWQLLFKPC